MNRFGYIGKIKLLIKNNFSATFGNCPVCKRKTFFVKDNGTYDRDFLECLRCGSLPRQRMLMLALETYSPNWRNLKIHESSPGSASSFYLEKECSDYSSSQYFPDINSGEFNGNILCQNIEEMSFSDNSFDIFISQEVMEHVFDAPKAFKEIDRILKPGGIHLFTTPMIPNQFETVIRTSLDSKGQVVYHKEPVYHGNPINPDGSIVTYDWGLDLPFWVSKNSSMYCLVYKVENKKQGLQGELCEAFVSIKP